MRMEKSAVSNPPNYHLSEQNFLPPSLITKPET